MFKYIWKPLEPAVTFIIILSFISEVTKNNKYNIQCTEIIAENQTLWFLDRRLVLDKLWWSCAAWCWTFLSSWITCACIWEIVVQLHNVHVYDKDICIKVSRIWVDVPWKDEMIHTYGSELTRHYNLEHNLRNIGYTFLWQIMYAPNVSSIKQGNDSQKASRLKV